MKLKEKKEFDLAENIISELKLELESIKEIGKILINIPKIHTKNIELVDKELLEWKSKVEFQLDALSHSPKVYKHFVYRGLDE